MSSPWQPDDPMPEPTTAWDHLRYVQRQLDQDGVEVGVSRQAVDETLTEFDRLTADNERLRAALGAALIRFNEYTASHAAKGTADGDAKADRNREMADKLRAALNPELEGDKK